MQPQSAGQAHESFFMHPEGSPEPVNSDEQGEQKSEGASQEEPEVGERISTEQARLASILAYIPFLCFIPLISMRHNREVYFHARQGLILFFIELAAVLFSIDKIADFVFRGVLVAAIAAAVAGISFALQGKNYRLPIVHKLADKSNL